MPSLRKPVTEGDYTQKRFKQFIRDMDDAGLEPYHYVGRCFWEGPAVNVDSITDAMSVTSVRCQYDGMGLGYVVYPK